VGIFLIESSSDCSEIELFDVYRDLCETEEGPVASGSNLLRAISWNFGLDSFELLRELAIQ